MYLKRIHNVNVGPIEDVEINFPFDERNNPKPVVIVGENGTGKSVLLSNIVDSFYEFAGKAFSDALKKIDWGFGSVYYKKVIPQEIHYGKKFMYSWIEYEDRDSDDKKATYLFRDGEFNLEDFCERENIIDKKNLYSNKKPKRIFIDKKQAEKLFVENAVCYFPPNRYEKPNWMGKSYYDISESEHPSAREKISGRLDKPISVENVNPRTLQWLLDVIADSRADVKLEGNLLKVVNTKVGHLLALGVARTNLETIMSEILGKKIFFGLNRRDAAGSRFNVNSTDNGELVVLSLDALSTGQSALFNMFATIIRYAEMDDLNKSVALEKIKGIVVIDEVELHLHTNLQREVLPKLLKRFPKVQFVISSHSPLFLLGMDKVYGKDGYEIYEMPEAVKISSEKFSEFEKAYGYMSETERHQQEIQSAIEQHNGKTLIITEGATDWKHMKAAYESLAETNEKYRDMDFEFLEYEPKNSSKNDCKKLELEMGKDKLKSTCEQCSKLRHDLKLRQASKLIFIADRDDDNIKKFLGKENEPCYINWGNNVFSFVLPLPPHREETPSICIEHYYTDEEIKTPECINGIERRLYMGNEFHKNGISLDEKLTCLDKNSCGEDSIKIIDGGSKKQVFLISDYNNENNLALPKMDFAENILNKVEGFEQMNFDNFRLIFDVVKKILSEPLV